MMHRQLRFRMMRTLLWTAAAVSFLGAPAVAEPKAGFGKITGVVRDAAGTPQLGASVEIHREGAAAEPSQGFLTNTLGLFRGEELAPGLYTIRVTLAGFLPTLQQHVRVTANLTTLIRIELESMFASLDRLRRQPVASADADDWKWVLRSAATMRPVLQWIGDDADASSYLAADRGFPRPRARLELTSGARRPGSVSNLADAAGTAFAYDQKLDGTNRLLLAGQMSYERAAAGGVAAVWLPTGSLDTGPQSAAVFRQAKLGPNGPVFHGLRLSQGGGVPVGDRLALHYGAEYVLVGLGGSAAEAMRPRIEADIRVSNDWQAALILASQSGAPVPGVMTPARENDPDAPLLAALNELDAFPTVLWRAGRPVLEGGWHEEISARRKVGSRGSLQIAAFHDDYRHVAVFGRGNDLATADFLRDFFSDGIAYDGGSSSSWGTRAGLREKLNESVEVTAVYTFAGALSPEAAAADVALRDALRTEQRHAFYGGAKAKLPRLGTRVAGGYQWIDGFVVSRLDSYGDSFFQTDPYLHVSMRQPLPKFVHGHWEALAECQNLLAQGYVPISGRGSRLVLVPAYRGFRGGLSVQF